MSNTCHGLLVACTPLLRTPCPSALIHMGFDLFPGSILPKATQPPHVCTLVSRNGQGEAVCSSCGLLQAGCPCKCGPSWCCRWREGRLPSGLYAYSCPRPTNIRVGLPLSITPNYNIRRGKKKRNKKQRLHLTSRLSFLAPGENEHKILPSPSGTNTEKIFLVES